MKSFAFSESDADGFFKSANRRLSGARVIDIDPQEGTETKLMHLKVSLLAKVIDIDPQEGTETKHYLLYPHF